MTAGEALALLDKGYLEIEAEALAEQLGLPVMEAVALQFDIVEAAAPMFFGQAIDERDAP